MRRTRLNIGLFALAGFVLLGLYIVVPELIKFGWGYYRPWYWIGTFIGSGLFGATVGTALGFAITKRRPR